MGRASRREKRQQPRPAGRLKVHGEFALHVPPGTPSPFLMNGRHVRVADLEAAGVRFEVDRRLPGPPAIAIVFPAPFHLRFRHDQVLTFAEAVSMRAALTSLGFGREGRSTS